MALGVVEAMRFFCDIFTYHRNYHVMLKRENASISYDIKNVPLRVGNTIN